VARILIVGGGCRGRLLASELLGAGHAVRITTRGEGGRAAIEALGAECWLGTPDRLATLRGSLDRVAIACWLLATAAGGGEELAALYTTRLELFLMQAIDTTVRGVVFEPAGAAVPAAAAQAGDELARRLTAVNRIPLAVLDQDPGDVAGWQAQALDEVDGLLAAASR
jgi:nucleoside-diphosphate-sugar epimerase